MKIRDLLKTIRKYWTIKPVTKVKQSKKIYNRKSSKGRFRQELKEHGL